MKDADMKRAALSGLALLLLASAASATGVTQTLKFTVFVSSFAGYMATPSAGWVQSYIMKLATSDANTKSTTDPKFVGLIQEHMDYNGNGAPTNIPDPSYLTVFGPNGAVLQTEPVPKALTISKSDCVTARYDYALQDYVNDGCPSFSYSVFTRKSNPGRVIVVGRSWTESIVNGNWTQTQKSIAYIVDLTAAVGSADRWTLLPTVNYSEDFNPDDDYNFLPGTEIDPTKGWLVKYDSTAKSVSVYTVVNK